MAESPSFKFQIDYKNPENVEAEVPGSQKIREIDSNAELNSHVVATTSDVQVTETDYTLSPVITVTKKEATFTKGDLKLQKVTVTEDIAMEEIQNGGHKISRSYQTTVHRDGNTITRTISTSERKHDRNISKEDKTHEEKRSKIPMLKFRQAAERVKSEKRTRKREDDAEKRARRSSIPKLINETKITTQPTIEPDDEFEKIYGEIVDDKQEEIDDKILAVKLEDPEKLESKFEEIIHAYEDQSDDQNVQIETVQYREKQSRIPALRRRKVDGERASNLSMIVDNIRLKNAVRKSQEFNIEQGIEGHTETRTIRTRRIYRERSREVNSTEETKPHVPAGNMDVSHVISGETIMVGRGGSSCGIKIEDSVMENTNKNRDIRENKYSKISKAQSRDINEYNIPQDINNDDKTQVQVDIVEITSNLNKNNGAPIIKKNIDITTVATDVKMRKDDMLMEVREKYKNEVNVTAEKNLRNDSIQANEKQKKLRVDKVSQIVTGTEHNVIQGSGAENIKIGENYTIHTQTEHHRNLNFPPNVKVEVVKTEISHSQSKTDTNNKNTDIDKLEDSEEKDKGTKSKITDIITDGSGSTERRHIMRTEQITKEGIKTGIPVFTKVVKTQSQDNKQTVEINKILEWKTTNTVTSEIQNNVSDTREIDVQSLKQKSITGDESKTSLDTNANISNQQDSTSEQSTTNIVNISEQATLEVTNKDSTASRKLNELITIDKPELIDSDINKQEQSNIEEATLLRGNVSRLINRLSFKESKPAPNTTLKDVQEFGSEKEERMRRLDKMISNFDKIEYTPTDTNLSTKETTVTTSINKKIVDTESKQEEMIQSNSPHDNSKILKQDGSSKNVTILKGNVNRLINKIGSSEEPVISTSKITEYKSDKVTADEQVTENNSLTEIVQYQTKESEKRIHDDTQGVKTMETITQFEMTENNNNIQATVDIKIAENKANYVKRNNDKDIEEKERNVSNVLSKTEIDETKRDINTQVTIERNDAKASEIKDDELPKRKTVLSKIAIFEMLETREPYPRSRLVRSENKTSKLVVKDININEKPRIVDEILKKHTITDSEHTQEIGTTRPDSYEMNKVWKTDFEEKSKAKDISVTRDVKKFNINSSNDNDDRCNFSTENNQSTTVSSKTDTEEGHTKHKINNNSIETNIISNVRANIHFISNANNDHNNAIEESSTNSTGANIQFMPDEGIDISTVQTVTKEYTISDIRPNIHFMPDDGKDVDSVETYIVTDKKPDRLVINSQNIDRKSERIISDIKNIAVDIKYSCKDDQTIANTEQKKTSTLDNVNEIYERVKTKCVVYERNVSAINREISRSESRDQTNKNERKNQNEMVGNELKMDESRKHKTGSIEYIDGTRSTEELRRAKSVVDTELDAVKGTVSRIVGRIKSVDFDRVTEAKRKISIKEMPFKSSVLEKIALFEGKVTAAKMETTTESRFKVTKKSVTRVISEEEYLQKIAELSSAKRLYQKIEMPMITLNNGAEMPILAVGTSLLDSRLLPHIIGAAIDLGYRAFDCAYIYGNEKEVGKAIQAKIDDGTVRREDLFITSKLWSTFHRPDLVETACKTSLQNMGLDYFDLYLIHNPMSFKEGGDALPRIATVLQYSQHDYLDAWFGMETILSKGLTRSIGVSNFNSSQIQRILEKGRVKPVVNQVECHPYLSQERLHNFCDSENITLGCFGVLGSKGTPAEYKSSLAPVIDDPLVQVMASGLNVTAAQLLIRYQIQSGHNVVVKASTATHLWDNLQALTFSITDVQMQALHALNRNKRLFSFIGMGDTHKNYPFLAAF